MPKLIVARTKTKEEAEAKACKYIKPGYRKITKTKQGYIVYVMIP